MTNPDNVGGLTVSVPLSSIVEIIGSMRNFADVADHCTITEVVNAPPAMRAWADILAELCRAAPAGGDEPVAVVSSVGLSHLTKNGSSYVAHPIGTRGISDPVHLYTHPAAPAGGDDVSGVMRDNKRQPQGTTSGGSPNYSRITPPVSAPAGSGEVDLPPLRDPFADTTGNTDIESLLFRLDDLTDYLNEHAGEMGAGTYADAGRDVSNAAALLRKLQQGADYEPAFWNVRKDGKHLILFPLNGAVTITTYLEMVAGAHPGSAIDAETLYRAASPCKEAFNG